MWCACFVIIKPLSNGPNIVASCCSPVLPGNKKRVERNLHAHVHVSLVACRVLRVTCRVSCFACHMSLVACHLKMHTQKGEKTRLNDQIFSSNIVLDGQTCLIV